LLREQILNFIQPKTLELSAFSESISIQESIQHLKFSLPQNLDLQILISVVRKSLILLVLGVLILSIVFYWAATRLIQQPIQRLVNHIHSLQDSSRGGNISLSQPLILSELDEVRESLNEYQLRLSQVHQNLDQKNQELWDLAFHDSLTGCYNRRAFDEHWNGLLSSLPSSRLNVSMILFDCNHFKALNDTYGHQVGDAVLRAISESIQRSLRSGDNLYRIGGDEFVLILLDADQAAAEHLAQRCLEYVGQYNFYQYGIDEPVRVSVGISSTVSDNRDNLINLHWQADIAMYHAKRPGNRHIMHYTPEMNSESGSVLSNRIIVAVHQAITSGDNLVMHYQPVVNLNDDRVEYYEALVRIRDGNDIISPADIFQIVESRRLEQEFDLAVFGCIHKDLASGKLPEGTGISINVSGPSIIDERVVEWLDPFVAYMGRYKLQVEVTETSLIRQLHKAGNVLNRLRDKGFIVALDDFGSGYSSLRYLASMPVDLVKFDITLIRGLEENSQQRTVIEGLAEVIMHAGFPLVAEGIEHIQLLDRVRDLGFCYAQGYLIGRPADCEELF
jgi:diguanylate cyclase (GGDEF)-like protein